MSKLVARRGILKSGISAAALAAAAPFTPFAQAQSGGFAEHGWPANYERISEKSISWLKSKGWWPLKVHGIRYGLMETRRFSQ